MAYTEEVQIPISVVLTKNDLRELKDDIDKTFGKIKDYEKSWSTKKNKFELIDVKDSLAKMTTLESKIGELQRTFSRVSESGPSKDLLRIQASIGNEIKTSAEELKRQQSLQGKLGAYSREYNKSLRERQKIEEEIASSQKAYEKAKSKIDTSDTGSKSALKNLEANFKKEQDLLNERLRHAKSEENIDAGIIRSAREEIANLKQSLAYRQNNVTELRGQEAELGRILNDENAVRAIEERRAQTLQRINAEISKYVDQLLEAQNQAETVLKEDMLKTGKTSGTPNRHDRAVEAETKRQEAEARKQEAEANKLARLKAKLEADAEREHNKAIRNRIAALKRERAAIQQSTSQYYYKLRSIKMLGYQFTALNNTVKKFGKTVVSVSSSALKGFLKLTNPITALVSPMAKLTASMKKFATASKNAAKNHDKLNLSLKNAVKTLLKYTLGIRSLFVLFNKLRSAMVSGMENLAQAFDPVNAKMSSIVTSLLQMKNAIAAAVEPMLNVLAPALAQIAELVSDIAVKVASFIATLTGNTAYVYKAVRAQVDYAESLNETKKQLSGLDKLNVINSDKGNKGMPDPSEMFEKVPIDAEAAEMANKLKETIDKLIKPIKDAWDNLKDFVIESWKYAFEQIKDLWSSIARDFWRVWEEEATQKIFENMFHILGDIGLIVGNLAKNLKIAWDTNENGYRILKSIRDIILEISNDLVDLFDYMVTWSDKLSFVPLFNDLANVLEKQMVDAVDRVGDLFVTLFEDIILEGLRFSIEQLLPQIIRIVGNLAEAVGYVAENFNNAWTEADRGKGIVKNLESLILIMSDALEDCSEKTVEWAKNLDFAPALESISKFLEDIAPLIQFISDVFSSFYQNVLLPFWEYIVEEGLPKLLTTLGNVVKAVDWDSLTAKVNEFLKAFEPFLEKVFEALTLVLEDLGTALADFLNSDTLDSIIDAFIRWMEDADPREMADGIETLAKAFIGISAALNLFSTIILPLLTGIMTIINAINMAKMATDVATLSTSIDTLSASLAGEEIATAASEAGPIAMLADKIKTLLFTFETSGGAIEPFIGFLQPIAGVVATVGGSIMSLTNFMDMLTNGFNLADAALVALGGALTGLGVLLLGAPATVAAAIAGIMAIGLNFVAWLATYGGQLDDWWDNLISDVGEWFNNLGENLGKWIGEGIVNLKNWLNDIPEAVKTWCAEVDWLDVGINIVEGILYIFSAPAQLLELIWTAVSNFFTGFVNGLCEAFGIASPAENMKPYGEHIVNGILEGILNIVATLPEWLYNNLWVPFRDELDNLHENLIEELDTLHENLMSWFEEAYNALTELATNVCSIDFWKNLGKDIFNGLWDGLKEIWDSVSSWLGDCWDSVKQAAADAFNIGSPSKVFRQIGRYIMQGFNIGLEEDEPDMQAMFEAMVPDESGADMFYDNFLSKVQELKTDAVDVITSMVEEINNEISSLSVLSDINNLTNTLSNIKLPDIALGATLPSNIEFTASDSEVDLSKLPELMKNAFKEAIAESEILQGESGDTIIEINGREIFRAVKDQNSQYKKQTGVSAFA